MSGRPSSQRKSYGRQLQLESLEKRCMLSLTAYADVDAGSVDDCPVVDSETVIVGKALPAADATEIACECPTPTEVVEETAAAGAPIIDCVVDEAIANIDIMLPYEDQLDYVTNVAEVERTLDEQVATEESVEPTTSDETVIHTLPPQEIGDTTTVEDVDGGSKPVDTPDGETPVIYYMGPAIETGGGIESAPTDDAGSVILHPADEATDREPPASSETGSEDPVIYTLGGETADGHTQTAVDAIKLNLIPHGSAATFQRARERRAERHQAKHHVNEVVATLPETSNDHASEITHIPEATPRKSSKPSSADVNPVDQVFKGLGSASLKQKLRGDKHRGHKGR